MNASPDQQPALSVIIPAFNEGAAIGPLLDAVVELATAHQWEVIVVDDGSSDDTSEQVAQRADGKILTRISHPYNRGYGAALKTGIRAAQAPLLATMDSDGQHDPNDLFKLLERAGDHDLVVGQRTELLHSPLWRMPGKWLLNRMANYLIRRKIPDLNSGMRLFRTEVVRKYLHLCPDGFSFSTTTTMVFFDRGYAVTYEPITLRKRHEGMKSTVRLSTGFDTLLLVFRLASLFQPLRVFMPVSLFFMLAGLAWGMPYIIYGYGVSVGSLLLILSSLLVFFFGLLTDQVAQLRLEKYE